MKKFISRQFTKDVKKIKNLKILAKIRKVIESVDSANELADISNVEKIVGCENFYRIKFDYRYRIGIYVNNESVQFLRVGTREDFYKKFP